MLGADGKSIDEQVYWPAIGTEVVERLQAFRELLSDPERAQEFHHALPAGADAIEGALAIHHTR